MNKLTYYLFLIPTTIVELSLVLLEVCLDCSNALAEVGIDLVVPEPQYFPALKQNILTAMGLTKGVDFNPVEKHIINSV